jgi:hypothetical protein
MKEGGHPQQQKKKVQNEEEPKPSLLQSNSPTSKHVKIVDDKTAEDISLLEAAREARLKRKSK